MRVHAYPSFAALPPNYDALFAEASARSFCLSRGWFELLAANVLDGADRLQLIGVEDGGPGSRPLGLLVARHRDRNGEFHGARSLSGLANFYTMTFGPLVAEGADQAPVLRALADAVCARRPRYDVVRLQPLDPDSEAYLGLARGLKEAGMVVHPYFHFGTWYEPTAGLSSEAYLGARPGPLRETIRRKARRLFGREGARFELVTGVAALERGIEAYERVYAASWKAAEPFPRFTGELARFCAGAGALRLGLLHLDGAPAAAQIWIVWGRAATLYKLAHDRRLDRMSPGTVLTMKMVERVIDDDRVEEVDLGAGDDAFKRLWASRRRELWGLIAFNPGTVRGTMGLARHVVPSRIKRALMRPAAAAGRR